MIQDTVFIITLALMGLIVAVFVFVAINAGKEAAEYSSIQTRAYSLRTKLFWALLIAGVLITVVTTQDLPFAATRGHTEDVTKYIDVSGHQWYWKLSDSSAKVGDTVVFKVTAADVTHGFGVYDEQLRLLGQTQAMPGYENALKITFEQPGQYKLMCMEYCGLAHHGMVSDFTVTAP